MEKIRGLKEYVASPVYRKAMGLPEDVIEEYRLLAQGEYNINYIFTHPVTGKEYLLRINCGSQMHLVKQSTYEFGALKHVLPSGRTPDAVYLDDSKTRISYGVMVMEFLPGCALDYRSEEQLTMAARTLADIHSVPARFSGEFRPVAPKQPLLAMMEECHEMFRVYDEYEGAPETIKNRIRTMLKKGDEIAAASREHIPYQCLINTELNSTNFLVEQQQKTCYLIDWEKPILGDPAQDLGHFLAPTTTFWKTDVIFSMETMKRFVESYVEAVNGRFDVSGLWKRVQTYLLITCLRGTTWCSMAWVQYRNPDKLIVNESTRKKLEDYLSDPYLTTVEAFIRSAS